MFHTSAAPEKRGGLVGPRQPNNSMRNSSLDHAAAEGSTPSSGARIVLFFTWLLIISLTAFSPSTMFPVNVLYVVDGDTVDVRFTSGVPLGANIEERVRLIGIDAPERSWRSKNRLEHWLDQGKVYLEAEIRIRCVYGRYLGHLWVEIEGKFFNVGLELVREGYAQPRIVPPNIRYVEEFLDAESR